MDKLFNIFSITLLQLLVTWAMAGMMWFAQIVHYPLYRKIKEGFTDYKRSYIRRASILIGFLMLIEAITAFALIEIFPDGAQRDLLNINIVLLVLIWLVTFLFQINFSQKLTVNYSQKKVKILIQSNWIRTFLWTIKGCVMVVITYYLI